MRSSPALQPCKAVFALPKRRAALGAVAYATLLSFAACAGPSFRDGAPAGASSSAGSASAAGGHSANGGTSALGGNAAAGAAGRSVGGAAGGTASGDAGAAGATEACECGVAQYCRAGTCFDCSDLSQLDFGNAEEVLEYPGGSLRFPREGTEQGSLFFTLVTPSVSELWYAPDVASSPGSVIGTSMSPRAALDYFGDPGSLGFGVLFDETGTDGLRSIRAATWKSGVLGAATDAPAPLAPVGSDDHSVAFARATSRAYFMSTREGKTAELVSGTLGSTTLAAVALELPGSSDIACPLGDADATPWVTPDGKLLLFSAQPVDASCTARDGTATDLFVALMDPTTGAPRATAVALAGVNAASSSESDPSFSADLCTLYFASDGGAAPTGYSRLYRAARR